MNKENGMPSYPDKYFELAIVDPEFGINIANSPRLVIDKGKAGKDWDKKIPSPEYFNELFRITKHQIIWGGNYFGLKPCRCFLIWDKIQPEEFSFGMCDYAWTSFDSSAKIYRYSVMNEKDKIHPTQKPIALYKWLLSKYAKPNDKILDTHVGSASSLIAFEDMGFEYVGFELDKDYYDSATKRLNQFRSQLKLAI